MKNVRTSQSNEPVFFKSRDLVSKDRGTCIYQKIMDYLQLFIQNTYTIIPYRIVPMILQGTNVIKI